MTRRISFLIFSSVAVLAIFAFVWLWNRYPNASLPEKVYKVGILIRGSGYEVAVDSYKRKMTELGYREGENISYDIRFVSAREELPRAVEEFLAEGMDLIHTYSTPATQAAYEITKTMPVPTPVVFGSVGDPLIAGVVRDFQHPGTNVTGVTSLSTELTARRLELLYEMNPSAKRIAMPHTDPENGDIAATRSVEIAEETARRLGMKLILLPVRAKEDNAAVAQRIMRQDADGMIVGGDSLVWGDIDMYIAQAIREKIPFAAFDLNQVQKGALLGFGPDIAISGEQSAVITHQILRGRSPAEIPVEVPRKLLLVINQATARAIGIVFPDAFLQKADVVIE